VCRHNEDCLTGSRVQYPSIVHHPPNHPVHIQVNGTCVLGANLVRLADAAGPLLDPRQLKAHSLHNAAALRPV
jgi:hypothetical protein